VRYTLVRPDVRQRAIQAVSESPDGFVVTIKEPSRSTDQNSALWPRLQAFSNQLLWPVNGRMVNLSPEEWKDVLTAAFRKESLRLAQGLDGGVVMLGLRTSKMSKREFSDFLEFINEVAADRDVELMEPDCVVVE